jgi:hypothetical protein
MMNKKERSMYSSSFFSNVRGGIADVFQQMRKGTAGHFLFAKILGEGMKKNLGVQEVAVEQIQGTISTIGDQFRSKNSLLARWREKYVQYVENPCPPVQVYKLGGRYYVEDGYRARIKGGRTIRAEVWELPEIVAQNDCCPAPVVRVS